MGKDYEAIRSIKREIMTSTSDSIKSFLHLKLSTVYFKNNDYQNFHFHLKKGKFFSRNSSFLKINAMYYEALNYLYNNDYDGFNDKISLVLKKLKPFKNKVSTELQLIIIQNISTYKGNTFKLDESIEILVNEGIPLAKASQNFLLLGAFNQSIANSFFSLGDYFKAIPYFEEAITQIYKVGDKGHAVLHSCYVDYAICLIKTGNYNKASDYLNKVRRVLKKYETSNIFPLYYYGLGTLKLAQNNTIEAIKQFKNGLKLFDKNDSSNNFNKTYVLLTLALAESKFKIKDYKGSYDLLDNLILNGVDDFRLLRYDLLYKCLEKLKDYENSNLYLKKFVALKDSLDAKTNEREYRLLEAKYNSSEKERRIMYLEKDKSEKEARIKNLSLLYGLVSTILIIALILFYFLFKNYKNQKKINKQQEIIHLQNISFLKSQKEIEMMQAMIEGEETERKRIARDLHDGIGSRLSSLKMQLENLKMDDSQFSNHEKFSENLSIVIKDLRRTAFNLVPETLSKLGLDLALKDLCFAMSNSTVSIQYTSNEIQPNIIPSHQVTIFRIIQELINNALKHSSCSELIVDCSQNGELFLVTVEDNGIGFNINDLECFNGLGLKNIRSRVQMLMGKFDLQSNQNTGTAFYIELKVHFT